MNNTYGRALRRGASWGGGLGDHGPPGLPANLEAGGLAGIAHAARRQAAEPPAEPAPFVAAEVIEAALEAERMHREGEAERRRVAELDLQQSEYDASLAERRYAACDPENRLIAAQLEKHWEAALRRVEACRARLAIADDFYISHKHALRHKPKPPCSGLGVRAKRGPVQCLRRITPPA